MSFDWVNETLDATHLTEFHQIQRVVANYYLTLGDLIGALHVFFSKIGEWVCVIIIIISTCNDVFNYNTYVIHVQVLLWQPNECVISPYTAVLDILYVSVLTFEVAYMPGPE